jgi:flavin-dependent dehydrogenase
MKKVYIVGGGPSGSLTAILLRREAEKAGRELDVTIIEAKPFKQAGAVGCNYCAGVVTGRTLQRFREMGMELPQGVIQRRIDGFYYVTEGGAIDFSRPDDSAIYTVFRGGGPRNPRQVEDSFDRFLLHHARDRGVQLMRAKVWNIERREEGMAVILDDGSELTADLVVGAFGVNSTLAANLQESLGYYPPPTASAVQTEIPLPDEEISERFGNRIIVFSFKHSHIRFVAVTPKRNYLTLTAIGKDAKMMHLREYLRLPAIARYLPENSARAFHGCHCHPRMPVGMARGAVGRQFITVGDALASRYFKNGLGSAYFTAAAAARSLFSDDTDGKINRRYVSTVRKRFLVSNRSGRVLFAINDMVYKNSFLAAATIAYIERARMRGRSDSPLETLMWSLFTGDTSYSVLLARAFNPLLLARVIWWYVRFAMGRFGKWMWKSIMVR